MDDLISRQAAIDALDEMMRMDNAPSAIDYNHGIADSIARIKYLPSVQKKGHWIDEGTNYLCSECHRGCWVNSDYCPWCGADMRGEQE